MRRILPLIFFLLSFLALSQILYARGGGGCLEEGTLIYTPSGTSSIEELKAGDSVLAESNGGVAEAKVLALMKVTPESYCEISCGGHRIRVTSEHPVEIRQGVFKIASQLKVGDRIRLSDGRKIIEDEISSVENKTSGLPAFNLLVSPGGTYMANGIVVHNKGCFLPDTMVRKADGVETPISSIRIGDRLLAFRNNGELSEATVRKILTHAVDEYLIVKTDRMQLRVTVEHPFYVGGGIFKTLEALKAGDFIFAFDGSGLSAQRIEAMTKVEEDVIVYNLQTDAPNTYFANGIAVHNKGGGFGGGGFRRGGFGGGGLYRSGRYSLGGSSPAANLFFIIFAGAIIVIVIVGKYVGNNEVNLDFLFSPFQVSRKTKKTMKLLEFISRQDPAFAPDKLTETARATFLKLQTCWEARDYAPMQPLMMNDLFTEHNKQIKGMIRNHEINVIASLSVDRIDLVNVRYTLKENRREFTALITATAMDIYVDDRTKEKIRGDDKPSQFQEFWTFHYFDKAWRLREIEQTGESDALKEENFFEQFTDVGVNQIYGGEAGKEGPSGPWLEKEVEVKDTRIERLLNFLVQTDKIWDRQKMAETARRIFLEVTLSWESGEIGNIPKGELFPELYDSLKEDIESNSKNGIRMEFRNLCVRKIELVLVRNMSDNSKDEYVARVRAHAQKIMLHKGNVISKDDDVTFFEQYLTFGRMGNMWKLKEVLLQANENGLVKQENVDQDSNAQQLQWYYQHRRAN
ncbi:MAG TPA: hypothetical protein DET40_00070 [Lentisphaeria bacterium]|nr:MAG: hypothetical protein A2X45_00710 [Lentisphaerae bacterium GWF2_50_93]HCE41927.1 hypothetical protein [Lentisphaeria bacterium]